MTEEMMTDRLYEMIENKFNCCQVRSALMEYGRRIGYLVDMSDRKRYAVSLPITYCRNPELIDVDTLLRIMEANLDFADKGIHFGYPNIVINRNDFNKYDIIVIEVDPDFFN